MKKLFVKIGAGLVISEVARQGTNKLIPTFKYAWIVGAAIVGVASVAAERFVDAWFDSREQTKSNH